MRVMCITTQTFTTDAFSATGNDPKVGNEYEVLRECIGYGKNGSETPCYVIAECNPDDCCYDQRNFSILPGIEADEMEEAEQEAIVPHPQLLTV
jgi:hypothetical protein